MLLICLFQGINQKKGFFIGYDIATNLFTKFTGIPNSWVEAIIDFGNDPPSYTIEWNHGETAPIFVHDCGIFDYVVTVFWEENGVICSKSSEPVQVRHMNGCEGPIGPGGGSGGDGGTPGPPPPLTNLNDLSTNSITSPILFPNPNKGQFQVSLPENQLVTGIEIFNSLGQQIWVRRGTLSGTQQINLVNQYAGNYLIRIQYAQEHWVTHRFIIQ